MSFNRSPIFRIALVLSVLALPVAAFGATESIGKASGGGSSLEWQLKISGHERVELSILAPDGTLYTKSFAAGKTPSVRLFDLGADLEDGTYNYELRSVPTVSAGVKKQLAAARAANDEAAAKKIAKDAGLVSHVQSGHFSVHNRMIVSPSAMEAGANDAVTNPRSVSSDAVAKPRIVTEDQVIPDDLIVQGSACVGLDCVNNENFGFDTIRMKENNLRVHFDDTSTSAGFPANDWRIVANGSNSGDGSFLAFEDSTAGRNTFVVEAGAPSNALYVDSTGNIGISQSAPSLDLHITTTDTPAMRYEQTNGGGFTAQTWDIGANEANFFVRDVTGGSRLSFRIRPGAPTSSVDISADGDVGVGTGSPDEKLHVFENVDTQTFMLVENPNTGTSANATLRAKADVATANFQAHSSTRTISRFGVTLGGWNEFLGTAGNGLAIGTSTSTPVILGSNSINRIHIDTDGDIGLNCNAPTLDLVIASGSGCTTPSSSINAGSTQFTAASSRTFKENIDPVAVPDLLDKIKEVGVYNYDFIDGPKDKIGLIAEDFHKVFGRGDEKYIDGSEV
ncbi:MAG TPA: tail fiber domain-containing protein, partial [Thermoanaerobaculia bacterium]|nr:tail fiber domain-containing protein [Thermoanaerobaculia bacterium]